MSRFRKAFLLLCLVAAMASAGFASRQTGSIHGRVLDQAKKPLTDSAVLLSGTKLMGSRTYITEARGYFHFPNLLPGTYALRVELPGHKTQVRKNIVIGQGQTMEWVVVLEDTAAGEMAVEEEVEVKIPSPVVDVRNPVFKTTYDSLLLATLPFGRDFYGIQNTVPGAITEDAEFLRTSSILGGTVRGQVYAIDGAFANDPVDFSLMTNADVDALDSVEFEMAGQPAEAGMAGTTYVAIMTKATGNQTSGSLAGYFSLPDFNKVLVSPEDLSKVNGAVLERYKSYGDLSLSLGGPVLEDMVWLYINARHIGWNRTNPYTPENRMAVLPILSNHYDLSFGEWLTFARVDFDYDKSIHYSGIFQYDGVSEPVYLDSVTPQASETFTTALDSGSIFTTTHQVSYQINPTAYVEARGSYLYRSLPILTQDDTLYSVYDYTQDVWWGSAPYNDDRTDSRLSALVSITAYADNVLGASHELKAGAEFEETQGRRDWYKSNANITYWYDYANNNPYYINPALKQGLLSLSTCPISSGSWTPKNGLRRFGGFVQDSLRAGRVALNLGVRLDYTYIYQAAQTRSLITPTYAPELQSSALSTNDLLTQLFDKMSAEGLIVPLGYLYSTQRKIADFLTVSPRLGLSIDLFGNTRTAFKASVGRYYEPFWLGQYGYDQVFAPATVSWIWTDVDGDKAMDLTSVDTYTLYSYANQDPTLSQYLADLKAPYTDEIQVGLEHELAADMKVGLNFIYKEDKNIIDTFDVNNGYDVTATDEKGLIWIPFTFTDPGTDGSFGTGDDQTLTVYGLRKDRPLPSYAIGNIPEATRKYTAAVLSFDKRLSHNWELKASLVYSSYRGNIGAGYTDTNFKNLMFDNPNTLINSNGPLWFDRPWQFRLMGTVILPWDIMASAYFQAYTGIPWNRTIARVYFPTDFAEEFGGVQTAYATVNAELPGSHRYQAYVNLDFHLEKAFGLGGGAKLSVIADVFNLLGRNGQYLYNDTAATIHYDTTPVTYTVSSTYGTIASLYGVRTIRLGLKVGF